MNTTYNARSLWANQVPYSEPDIVTPTSLTPVTREMIYVSTLRSHVTFAAHATQHRPLFSDFSLHANATVVTP